MSTKIINNQNIKKNLLIASLVAFFAFMSATDASAAGLVYTANNSSNNVSVIDVSTNAVLATVAVGSAPAAVGVNSSTNRAYIANRSSNSVSVIDTTNNTVLTTITVGSLPVAVAVNSSTNRIYVANRSSNSVSVIDGSTNTVIATISVGSTPFGVGINPSTNRAYTANFGGNNVSVIDTTSNSVLTSIAVGTAPFGVGVNPVTNKIYIPNFNSANISVIDGLTNTVSTTISAGTSPRGIGVNMTTNRIYVSNNNSNDLTVINGSTDTVLATVSGLNAPVAVTVNEGTDRAYIANAGNDTVSVLNGSTNAIDATVAVGAAPQGIAVHPTGIIAPPSDTTPPTGTIAVNSGAAFTNTPNVTIFLTCGDPESGCSQMQIAVDGTADGEPFEAFVASKAVTLLTGDGTKMVAVKFKNGAGLVSVQVSDSIVLDATAPAVSGITPTQVAANFATSFSATYSDAASGVTSCTFFADTVSQGATTIGAAASGTASKTFSFALGSHTAQIKCMDAAGNEGIGAVTTIDALVDTDGDGIPDVTDSDDDNDGISDAIDTQPLVVSIYYTDGPVALDGRISATAGGTTHGFISSTGGLTLLATELDNALPAGLNGVTVGASGTGSTALFKSCAIAEPFIETLLNAGDTATITCGSQTTKALQIGLTGGKITFQKRTGTKANGSPIYSKVSLRQNQIGSVASPENTAAIQAAPTNTQPTDFEVVDTFANLALVSGVLNPAQSAVLVTPPTTGDVVVTAENTSPTTAGALTFTLSNQTTASLDPTESLAMTLTQDPTSGTVTEVSYSNTSTTDVTLTAAATTIVLVPTSGVDMTVIDQTVTITNTGTVPVQVVTDGTPVTLDPGQTVTQGSDQCPGVAGNVGQTGCPFADKTNVELHNVYLGGGSSSKGPLAGATVRVFDRNNLDFQGVAGSKNPDGALYGVIYESNAGKIGECITVADGSCLVGEPTAGDYLVIVKFFDPATNKTVYIGRPKSPSDFVNGLATKDIQIMKVFQKGLFKEYRGGSKVVVTGSMLEVIMPESAVWEGEQSLYPFVFTSDSDWNIDVCAEVPAGYSILGYYDETGNFVTSAACVQTVVAGVTKIIAFQVSDIGSPEPSLTANFTVKHKNKTTKLAHKISDLRKPAFDQKVNEAKEKMNKRHLNSGQSLWQLVRAFVGGSLSDPQLKALVRQVAEYNKVNIPEWGVDHGEKDARKLLIGSLIDMTPITR